MFSITKNDTSYITDAKSINKYLTSRNIRKLFHIISVKFDYISDISDKDIFLWNTHLISQFCVFLQVLLLTMNWNKIFRLCKSLNNFKFLLASVSWNMNFIHRFINNMTAMFNKFINDCSNSFFITRNRISWNDYKVTWTYCNLSVVWIRHSWKCRHRLALTSSSNENYLLLWIFI